MKHVILCLLVLCTIHARAQKNYVPAIVISQQQDSLRGFIDYRNWRITPGEISFKKELSAAEQRFKPTDISGFLVLPVNELYITQPVDLDITPQSLDHLLQTDERTYQRDTVFLLQIVKGAYNLYVYTDKYDQAHYVYNAAGQPVQELRQIRRRAPNGTAIITLNYYQQQLTALFDSCATVGKRAGSVLYKENALRDLFIQYHQCRNPSEQIAVKAKEKSGVRWGLLAGASANSYRFKGSHFLAGAAYKSSVSPLLGLFVDVPVSRNRHQYVFSAELLYKMVDASGMRDNENPLYKWQEQINLQFSYAQVNLIARYVYPEGTVRPFANIGWGTAFVVSESKNERYRTSGETRTQLAIDGPRKIESSILGGIGVQYRRFQLEARYAGSNGFSPYQTLGIGVRSWQGILRFAF